MQPFSLSKETIVNNFDSPARRLLPTGTDRVSGLSPRSEASSKGVNALRGILGLRPLRAVRFVAVVEADRRLVRSRC